MHTFHLLVWNTTNMMAGKDKDSISKYVNVLLTTKLTEEEAESLVKIMEQRLSSQ